MEWISGIQRAIDDIEAHLADDIDLRRAARLAACSEYNLMRVFSVLSGWTLSEYIRARRMTLAAQELMDPDARVLHIALKYGYDSPESFQRAFVRFHGVTPSAARKGGVKLRCVPPVALKIVIEGGYPMNYRIENAPERHFIGYSRHFAGSPDQRDSQTHDFFVHTRLEQFALKGMCRSLDPIYSITRNITGGEEEGFDFTIAMPFGDGVNQLNDAGWQNLVECNPEIGQRFHRLTVPAGAYAVFETERSAYPTLVETALRREAISQWLPTSGYQLRDAPELNVTYWLEREQREERYIELWLPVERG